MAVKTKKITSCPDCGCGGTGEYIVANMEWGICAIPQDYVYGAEMCRLCDYISFKKADSGTMILTPDPNIPGIFSENVSPLALNLNTVGSGSHSLRLFATPPAPADCTPDSVAFIKDHLLPAGYCYDPDSPPTWNCPSAWLAALSSGSYHTANLCPAPYSSCSSTSWALSYNSDRVLVQKTSGAVTSFYSYYGIPNAPTASVYGWLMCGEQQYAERDYCNANAPASSPKPTAPCQGSTRSRTAYWFRGLLQFYVKGRLTYYNV